MSSYQTALLWGCLSLAIACQVRAADEPLLAHFDDASELIPIGGIHIFRVELDLNGDERPELFLSQSGNSGRSGSWWFAYSPESDGRYRFIGDLVFPHELFRLDAERGELVTLKQLDLSTSVLTTYAMDGGQLVEVWRRELPARGGETEDARAAIEEWREQTGVAVWVTTLDQVDAAAPLWRSVDDDGEEETWSFEGRVVTR